MIPYSRDPNSVVPASAVKIIGLGGAGANMLERLALDGADPSTLVVLNTDIRTLEASLAKQKIQLGTNLTKGLGTGGDPDLGQQAVLEAEAAVREQIRGCRIVFLCAGLGGGTGSGASPIVTRIAREEGAFVVVFATMPFSFEGKRRRDQAEASLNQLAVLSNALVTFDNNRMGELVLAKQGIHEAFAAADRMIGESIKAVIRLVTRPGLIHVGLDDLMSALRTTRSRCLFGSGIAEGKDRAAKALENAFTSPLLDQGALLKETRTVLAHLCGGESLTLYEVELLMQQLQKHVPADAQILFGAAVDASMKDALSVTLISSLPEDSLAKPSQPPTSAASQAQTAPEPRRIFTPILTKPAPAPAPAPVPTPEPPAPPAAVKSPEPLAQVSPPPVPPAPATPPPVLSAELDAPDLFGSSSAPYFAELESKPEPIIPEPLQPETIEPVVESEPQPAELETPRPVTIAEFFSSTEPSEPEAQEIEVPAASRIQPEIEEPEPAAMPPSVMAHEEPAYSEEPEPSPEPDPLPEPTPESPPAAEAPTMPAAPPPSEIPRLKLGIKASSPASELGFDSAPRGRFEGESPNVFEGEDLDLPPFLRKKK